MFSIEGRLVAVLSLNGSKETEFFIVVDRGVEDSNIQ